jgi:hypothetical protein
VGIPLPGEVSDAERHRLSLRRWYAQLELRSGPHVDAILNPAGLRKSRRSRPDEVTEERLPRGFTRRWAARHEQIASAILASPDASTMVISRQVGAAPSSVLRARRRLIEDGQLDDQEWAIDGRGYRTLRHRSTPFSRRAEGRQANADG